MAGEGQTVRIDGIDYPFVAPGSIPDADLRWLDKLGGKPAHLRGRRRTAGDGRVAIA